MADDTAQQAVTAARNAYHEAEARLSQALTQVFVDREAASALLISNADEYGVEHALGALLSDPKQCGTLTATINDQNLADLADTIEASLEAALVAQDRLDLATAARERGLPATENRLPLVNIGGREYVINAASKELRAVDNPTERIALPDDAPAKEPAPSLTAQHAKQHGISPATPSPSKDRTRPR